MKLRKALNHGDYRDSENIIKYTTVKNNYKIELIDNMIRKYRKKKTKKKNDEGKVQFISAEYTNVLPKNKFIIK